MLRRRRCVTWGDAHGGLSSVVLSSRGGGTGTRLQACGIGLHRGSQRHTHLTHWSVHSTYVSRVFLLCQGESGKQTDRQIKQELFAFMILKF